MVGMKVGLNQMSGGIKLKILSSVPSLCQLLVIRLGIHASNVRTQSFFDKTAVMKHICQNGFMLDYETWVFHGEQYNAVVAEEDG
jgi:hypothetical protein